MVKRPLYVDQHECASVLVAEFRNAAALVALPEAQQFQFLHEHVYVPLDEAVGRHKVYKLFGAASGFMLSTNVADADAQHAATLLACARDLLPLLEQVRLPSGESLDPAMALSTGAMSSGLLGSVSLTYQLVGGAVSTARELNKIQGEVPLVATRSFCDALPPEAAAELVPLGPVGLACVPGPADVFTLGCYRHLRLSCPSAGAAGGPAPTEPGDEEGPCLSAAS